MSKACCVAYCLFLFGEYAVQAQLTPEQSCRQDLDAIPSFLLANDAGAKDELAQKGQAYFDKAMTTAQAAVSAIASDRECDAILRTYLLAWRPGHLAEMPLPGPDQDQPGRIPNGGGTIRHAELKALSGTTLLLSIPTFEASGRADLETIFAEQHELLASHPNWIIDVRANDGGNDSSFQPLLPWLMSGEVVDVGADFLVTPANIEAQNRICAGDENCKKMILPLVERMEKAKTGDYVPLSTTGSVGYHRIDQPEPRRPARVAILIDHDCGSTCEQFLLTVRQSYSIKLIGRRTYGSLDFSNLRPSKLPSGKRQIFYATSRSERIPAMPVDGIGVMPDIYLPLEIGPTAKDDEVTRVKNWLEGGTLRP